MSNNKPVGDAGELDVINKVPCPNCDKKLTTLPKNYPLFDVQCTGCSFRAQVKTSFSKPKNEVFGAGWDIMEKVLKSGYMVPPLIVNFNWSEKGVNKQKILFYPFIPKSHLRKRQLSSTARRANYKMFNYYGLDKVPCFSVYHK
jgi:hypothetical protein